MASEKKHLDAKAPSRKVDHLRFHRAYEHLAPTFGSDRFALKAEAFCPILWHTCLPRRTNPDRGDMGMPEHVWRYAL